MSKRFLCIGGLLFVVLTCTLAHGQNQWMNLNGPNWISGIDVAYGPGDQANYHDWYRYLIGGNGSETRRFYWRSGDTGWQQSSELNGAIKIITYSTESHGNYAFCSAYGDDIYLTDDGGATWAPLHFGNTFDNTHFTTIEVKYHALDAGTDAFVGTESYAGYPTAYIYHTVGSEQQWDRLGGPQNGDPPDPIYGLQINDIECDHQGSLFAGTEDGLFMHTGSFEDNWNQLNFDNLDVVAVEDVDCHGAGARELAAVRNGASFSLWFSPNTDYFDDPAEIEPGTEPFNHDIRDIAANQISETGYISCYIAANDGLYLIYFDENSVSTIDNAIDLKELPTLSGYYPMKQDYNFVSVVSYWEQIGDNQQITTLAATPFNVYQIVEQRDGDGQLIDDLKISDAVTGTYSANVIAGALTINEDENSLIFTLSDNGLIKSQSPEQGWAFVGKAFDPDQMISTGTDISVDFSENNLAILASSNDNSAHGMITRSTDGGVNWSESSPSDIPVPQINAVCLNTGTQSNEAWAAGNANHVWRSVDDNGDNWSSSGSFSGTEFLDIYVEPTYYHRVFACGTGDELAAWSTDHGSSWNALENGLTNVSYVNQLDKETYIRGLYAATDNGFYKIYDFLGQSPTWSQRTDGIGTPELGSVAVDPNNDCAMLVSSSPNAAETHIWASGDSGRSWIDLPLGTALENSHINKITASQDENSGFLAFTDNGVFKLGDIFKSGSISEDETWGPGVVIVNGDVSVTSGTKLSVVGPCTIYATYNFDITSGGLSSTKSEIRLQGHARFDAIGTAQDPIVFTSSRPTSKTAGDWTGIVFGISVGYPVVHMEHVEVEYADKGVFCSSSTSPDTLQIVNCTFANMTTAGLDIDKPAYVFPTIITGCTFHNCGSYGIWIRNDQSSTYPSTTIEDNLFENCNYGIYYSGNSNSTYTKNLTLSNNKILFSTPSASSQYGIYVTRIGTTYNPVLRLDADTILQYNQGGIWLNYTNGATEMTMSRIYHCGPYGLKLTASAIQVKGSSSTDYNIIDSCTTGIYYDANSTGTTRWAKIKGNTSYGVYIVSHDLTLPQLPDFGQDVAGQYGNNSIHTQGHTAAYYDMYNASNQANVNARRCWWGSDGAQIRNVNYTPALVSNPIPKRGIIGEPLPNSIVLGQNYPNPFNPTTQIGFGLADPCFVSLKIYNITGQLVKTLVSEHLAAGEHYVIWDGCNSDGISVASGAYFYVLSTDYGRESKTMTLIR
jgi:hypothetical protein